MSLSGFDRHSGHPEPRGEESEKITYTSFILVDLEQIQVYNIKIKLF